MWKPDDGRCQWRTDDGGICGSRHQVEFHHKQDRARGGLGSEENVILLCHTHHHYATDIAWGGEFIDQFRKRPPPRTPEESQL